MLLNLISHHGHTERTDRPVAAVARDGVLCLPRSAISVPASSFHATKQRRRHRDAGSHQNHPGIAGQFQSLVCLIHQSEPVMQCKCNPFPAKCILQACIRIVACHVFLQNKEEFSCLFQIVLRIMEWPIVATFSRKMRLPAPQTYHSFLQDFYAPHAAIPSISTDPRLYRR